VLFVYLVAAGLGVSLIAVSLILGGHDADGDAHLDADAHVDGDLHVDADASADVHVDGDLHVDADGAPDAAAHADAPTAGGGAGLLGWLPLASMRFWTFLVAGFGLTGAGLTAGGAPWGLALAVALLVGIGGGWGAAAFFRRLLHDRVSGETSLGGLVGREAQVALPVRPLARGRILVTTGAGVVELSATTRDGAEIPRGATVLIADVRDGVADVTALAPAAPDRQTHRARDGRGASDPVSS
jgi:hypothetical protein